VAATRRMEEKRGSPSGTNAVAQRAAHTPKMMSQLQDVRIHCLCCITAPIVLGLLCGCALSSTRTAVPVVATNFVKAREQCVLHVCARVLVYVCVCVCCMCCSRVLVYV